MQRNKKIKSIYTKSQQLIRIPSMAARQKAVFRLGGDGNTETEYLLPEKCSVVWRIAFLVVTGG